jgi:hypothetical protein
LSGVKQTEHGDPIVRYLKHGQVPMSAGATTDEQIPEVGPSDRVMPGE